MFTITNGSLSLHRDTLIGLLAGIAAKVVLHLLVGAYELWRLWDPAKSVFG